MGYIESNLMNGENVLYRARLHSIVFLWPAIWFAVAIAFFNHGTHAAATAGRLFALIAILKGMDSLINFLTSEFGLTNQRVIAKVGFIRRNSIEVFLSKVEAIEVSQGLAGRLLGYGSVTVSGTGGTRDPFRNISKPLELKRKIQEQIALMQKP